MKHTIPLSLILSLLAACSEHTGESVTPEERPAQAPATQASEQPSTASSTVAPEEPEREEPKPLPPAPDRMFVVAEGRCRDLGVSSIDDRTFLHYTGPGPIVELGPDGAPTGATISGNIVEEPDGRTWSSRLSEIDGLGGHFPDRVFTEVLLYPREGTWGSFRLTTNGWKQTKLFGSEAVERVWPWYDDSLLALASWVDDKGPRFGVVRGKPKGPRFGGAQRKSGCKNIELQQVLVAERGDVVVTFACQERPNLFVTHWRAGDPAGKTHDLGIVPVRHYIDKIGAPKLAADASDGFYLATESESGNEHLWHGKDANWDAVELPAKTKLTTIATDPKGQLWIAGSTIARRDGSEWVTIPKPAGSVSEMVGAEHGTPWIRSGSGIWRVGDDALDDVTVPPSAFFENESLNVTRMHAAGPDDVWAVATYVVQRRGKGKAGRRYRAVLHSRPSVHPLRCGELTDGREMEQPYRPWPTAAGEGCEQRMLLLLRRKRWDDDNPYDKVRRAVKKVDGIETVRFAEMEVGGAKYLVAIAPDQAVLDAIKSKAKAKRLLKYKFPEVVCGDQAVLDAAGVVVHRELDLAPAP